jgi:hypothetical protein
MTEQDEQRSDHEIGACHVCGQVFDTQLALSDTSRMRTKATS